MTTRRSLMTGLACLSFMILPFAVVLTVNYKQTQALENQTRALETLINERKDLLEACEKTLPNGEKCVLVAVPKSEKK